MGIQGSDWSYFQAFFITLNKSMLIEEKLCFSPDWPVCFNRKQKYSASCYKTMWLCNVVKGWVVCFLTSAYWPVLSQAEFSACKTIHWKVSLMPRFNTGALSCWGCAGGWNSGVSAAVAVCYSLLIPGALTAIVSKSLMSEELQFAITGISERSSGLDLQQIFRLWYSLAIIPNTGAPWAVTVLIFVTFIVISR